MQFMSWGQLSRVIVRAIHELQVFFPINEEKEVRGI